MSVILKNKNLVKYERHPFHLVDPSPWPIMTGNAILAFALGFVMAFCTEAHWHVHFLGFLSNTLVLCFILSRWFTDIVIEGTFEGQHTSKVQENILFGMKLFIASEVMFFFSFFWAFFHFSMNPAVFVGATWPPFSEENIFYLDYASVPLANTAILIGSGVKITLAQRSLMLGKRSDTLYNMFITILLGLLFTALQGWEYSVLPFSISTTVYGSIFYMITGFHGLHVIIGTIFLIVCFFRMLLYHFLTKYHVGFVCAIWYWHFVDIVWIALFFIVYVWSS